MDAAFLLIGLVAFGASLLTFFSGFGLGTLLSPVFALFFEWQVAIALTAVVHLANNVFKAGLTVQYAHWGTVLRFGLPAILAAIVGAWCLERLATWNGSLSWSLTASLTLHPTPLKTVMGGLLVSFGLWELVPRLRGWSAGPRWLIAGGLLSGFFGGLSGHQGALRSAFLMRMELSKQCFVATGVVIACAIDVARIGRYVPTLLSAPSDSLRWDYVAWACMCAFAGAVLGNRLLKKVTLSHLQRLVGAALVCYGTLCMAGVL